MKPVTVAEIVKIYDASRTYIYKLASTREWRRIRHDGRIYYNREDVDRDLGRGT